jgi:hypothetical protein
MRELVLSYRSFDGSSWTVDASTVEGDSVRLSVVRVAEGDLPPSLVSIVVPGPVLALARAMLEVSGSV